MPAQKYTQIYLDLKEKIEDGTYPEQGYLPSEYTLIEQYGCSRNTVRRAISQLADEAYVQSIHGKGVIVIYHQTPKNEFSLGGIESLKESAKMLATLTHMMRGTPYVYQGEEIGMTNVDYSSIDQYRDVESLNYYQILLDEGKSREEALHIIHERSRDNGRTPMQWTGGENGGFTSGTPWIGVPANHTFINVEAEEIDADSILAYYKKLIALRKEYPVIAEGTIRFLDAGTDEIIAYEREYKGSRLIVICNMTAQSLDASGIGIPSNAQILISNSCEKTDIGRLKPYETAVYLTV